MTPYVRVPILIHNGVRWGRLSFFGTRHEFCGEKIQIKNKPFTFTGEHRVQLCVAKKNVHWKIPEGVELNISEVTPARRLPRSQ